MRTGRVLCLLLAALLLPVPDAGAQQVKIKATLQVPVDMPPLGVTMARFKAETERLSKGSLAIEIFDKGELFNDSEVVDAVASGAVDIGITATQSFVGKAPSLAIMDLPFLFNFKALVDATAKPDSGIRKLIDKTVLTEVGVRVLLWQAMGNGHFYSKGHNVADPARLKGQRVAVPGKALADFVVQCGGRPTPLPPIKFHDVLKSGKLKMAMMPLTGLRGLGLWKVQDTITLTAHAPVEFLLVVNERTWQSLSPDHRAAMAEAARNAERSGRALAAKLKAELARFAADKGLKLVHPTPDQIADWRACSADMVADYMARNGEKAFQLMAAYRKLRTDPCCMAPPSEETFTRH